MTVDELNNRDSLDNPRWVYDYSRGKVASPSDIESYFPAKRELNKAIKQANDNISTVNDNFRHKFRTQMGMLAQRAFFIKFLAVTGMNLAQGLTLKWTGDYQISAEQQTFRSIKYRADGKEVVFSVEKGFIKEFKSFLTLRKYLLADQNCDTLFFTFGTNQNGAPKKLNSQVIYLTYTQLQLIDPLIPRINSRQLRVKKADFLINETDVSVTAMMLNNTEETVRKHYAAGSYTKTITEVSDFFEKLTKYSVIIKESDVDNLTEVAVGECRKKGSPNSLKTNIAILPDCRQPEGCLFCDQFVVHADEKDIRKLISCRYCIKLTSPLSDSKEHFDKLFSPVFQRIQFILDEIKNSSAKCNDLVNRILIEVEEEEELDIYWEKKLQILIELGLIV